jgi:hypothetical protein
MNTEIMMLAEELRQECNKLSPAERSDCIKRAMEIINGAADETAWISVHSKLPRPGQKVHCKFEGVYSHRVVTFYRDSLFHPRFGGLAEGGSQPATHWAPIPE